MAWTAPKTNFVSGDVLTAAQMNAIGDNLIALPRGYITGSKKTSNQSGISTITDITSLSVTFTMENGRWYRIMVQADVAPTVSTDTAVLYLTDGSNNDLMRAVVPFSQSNSQTPQIIYYEQAGSTGSVTRKVRLARVSGTGTFEVQAASTRPALILVEDIGQP